MHDPEEIHHKSHLIYRYHAGQHHHYGGGGKPHYRDDQFAPHLLVDGGGQGEHDVTLVPQKIAVKPLEHQRKTHEAHADDGHHKGHDHQRPQDVQQPVVRAVHDPGGKIGAQCRHQQHQIQRAHDAPGGTKLVL